MFEMELETFVAFIVHPSQFIVRYLFIPLKRSFPKHIVEPDQEHRYKHQHRKKAIRAHCPEIDGIRIKENYFHIEQHEQDGGHQIFDGNGNTGIALRLDAAFKILIFLFAAAAWSKFWYHNEYQCDKP